MSQTTQRLALSSGLDWSWACWKRTPAGNGRTPGSKHAIRRPSRSSKSPPRMTEMQLWMRCRPLRPMLIAKPPAAGRRPLAAGGIAVAVPVRSALGVGHVPHGHAGGACDAASGGCLLCVRWSRRRVGALGQWDLRNSCRTRGGIGRRAEAALRHRLIEPESFGDGLRSPSFHAHPPPFCTTLVQ